MPILLHQTPEGEIVVHACESWPEGVESFWLIVDEHYGDSPENVWDVVEREDTLAAFSAAGDVVVLTAYCVSLGTDGSFTVVPESGDRWLLRG